MALSWLQCCGDEKWGDWRPHLAMVLSNLSSSVDVEARTMATMGDTLGEARAECGGLRGHTALRSFGISGVFGSRLDSRETPPD